MFSRGNTIQRSKLEIKPQYILLKTQLVNKRVFGSVYLDQFICFRVHYIQSCFNNMEYLSQENKKQTLTNIDCWNTNPDRKFFFLQAFLQNCKVL